MRIATRLLVLVGLLDLIELVIHLACGWSCWGYNMGGHANMLVILNLSILFIVMIVVAFLSASGWQHFLVCFVAATVGGAISIVAFIFVGWRLFTSVHYQGRENLLFFGALNAGIVLVVMAMWTKPSQRMQRTNR